MQSSSVPERLNDADISININGEIIHEIEKELQTSPNDVISLGFLLYDDPNAALRNLTAYQQVFNSFDFPLYEWYQLKKAKATWKHEFLEALLICQLYGIVRKLDFNVSRMKKYFFPDSLQYSVHINPFKKVLYKLCENIESENLMRLKRALRSYDISVTDHEFTELIFLKLMCINFICVNNYDKVGSPCEYKIEKLAKILENIPGLMKYAKELRNIQISLGGEQTIGLPLTTSTPIAATSKGDVSNNHDKGNYEELINEIFRMINQLHIEDITGRNIKSDTLGSQTRPKLKK